MRKKRSGGSAQATSGKPMGGMPEEQEERITFRDFLALTAAMYRLLLPKLFILFAVLVVVALLLKWYLR